MFQAFNLVSDADRRAERRAAVASGRRRPRAVTRRRARRGRPGRPGRAPAERAVRRRAAAGRRGPRTDQPARRWSSPTSRPAPWTAARRAQVLGLLRDARRRPRADRRDGDPRSRPPPRTPIGSCCSPTAASSTSWPAGSPPRSSPPGSPSGRRRPAAAASARAVVVSIRRSASAFVAVAIGVALVAAATLLLASGRPPGAGPARARGGRRCRAPRRARRPTRSCRPGPGQRTATAGLVGRLAALPGVAAAVPDRTFYAQPLVDGRPSAADGEREDAHAGARLVQRPARWTAPHGRRAAPPAPARWSSTARSGCAPARRVTLLDGGGAGVVHRQPVWSTRPASTSRTRSPPRSRPASGPSGWCSPRAPIRARSPRRLAVVVGPTDGC